MFELTFFGHQGWLFRTERACILADALLVDAMGHGVPGPKVWPPRSFDFAQLPPLDAVFVSHEHSDHFDVGTLAKLDRAIPILLPARASRAARAIVEEMGFTARLLAPGDVVTIGDFELAVDTANHVANDAADEWDVMPFAVRDRAGDGSFLCFVDVPIDLRFGEAPRRGGGRARRGARRDEQRGRLAPPHVGRGVVAAARRARDAHSGRRLVPPLRARARRRAGGAPLWQRNVVRGGPRVDEPNVLRRGQRADRRGARRGPPRAPRARGRPRHDAAPREGARHRGARAHCVPLGAAARRLAEPRVRSRREGRASRAVHGPRGARGGGPRGARGAPRRLRALPLSRRDLPRALLDRSRDARRPQADARVRAP